MDRLSWFKRRKYRPIHEIWDPKVQNVKKVHKKSFIKFHHGLFLTTGPGVSWKPRGENERIK